VLDRPAVTVAGIADDHKTVTVQADDQKPAAFNFQGDDYSMANISDGIDFHSFRKYLFS
jgi:hypothetical protein